jgi:hypothetical protein
MKRISAYRFRLLPTAQQASHMARTAGSCRLVWNQALEAQRAARAAGEKRPGFAALGRRLTAQRAEHEWLRDLQRSCVRGGAGGTRTSAVRSCGRALISLPASIGLQPPSRIGDRSIERCSRRGVI